jgi:3-oxoacyl-[acyl-carrier protein] reductase
MKNVLITGGSRGIGAACVREFSKKDYRVFFNYNQSEEAAKQLSSETGAIPVKADISKSDEVEKMIDFIHTYGKISILINNAGIAEQKLFSDISESDWDRMFDVNIKGMFLVTKKVLPDMIHEKCGKIINFSSIWGIAGASCEVHYSASKAAVIGFTKALAKEVGLSGINVNCIAPGVIDTEMNGHLDEETKAELCEETPLNRMGTADEVAKLAYFLSSPDSDFITGQVISPNGGIVI